MIDSNTRSRAVNAPVPGPTPTPPDRAQGTAAHPFAELLQQQKAMSSPAAGIGSPIVARAAPPAVKAAAPVDRAAQDSADAPHDAAQARARGADASRAASRATPSKTKLADNGSGRVDAHDDTAADATAASPADAASGSASGSTSAAPNCAVDPAQAAAATAAARQDSTRAGAAESLLAEASRAKTARDDAPTDGTDAASAGRPVDTAAASSARADRAASRADDRALGAATDKATGALDANPAASFTDALAASKAPHMTATGPERTPHDAAALASLQTGPSTQSTATADAPTASATVARPVDSPEFAAAFGMQISTMVKDGVQKAELHLNPAEMGPVSIQITLDGSLARVDFGADVAATRHAIEAGLPELASALQNAGFTLAGGGVSQHAASNGGRRDEATSGGTPVVAASAAAIGAIDRSAQRQARRVAAGGVDVFA